MLTHDLMSVLGLSPPDRTGGEDAKVWRLVAKHLVKARDALFGPQPRPLTLPQGVKVVTQAAQTLNAAGEAEAVLVLRDAAPDVLAEQTAFVIEWVAAATQVNRPEEPAQSFDRLRALSQADPRQRDLYFQLLTRHGLYPRASDHLWRWGPMPGDVATFLPQIEPSRAYAYLTETMVQRLFALRGEADDALPDFRARLLWGNAVFGYLHFLLTLTDGLRRRMAMGETLEEEDELRILDLLHQADALETPADYTLLRQARDAGKSIVLTGAHLGYFGTISTRHYALEMPYTQVVNYAFGGANDDSLVMLSPVSEGMQIAYAKLIKRMRAAPRLIEIYPDGGEGQGQHEMDFMGERIRLGLGACNMALLGRAAVFFHHRGWRAGKMHIEFTPGPVAGPETDGPAFTAAFAEFYLDCVRKILLGPPENIGLCRAFWPAFTTPHPTGAGAAE